MIVDRALGGVVFAHQALVSALHGFYQSRLFNCQQGVQGVVITTDLRFSIWLALNRAF